MSTIAPDSHDRFPTDGPDGQSYERYRFEEANDDEVLIYDTELANAWIQAASAVSLDECR
ncbi:MAG: hypothetical protein ACI8XM_001924 [Haloarculaceae archaeon]|jgi:hypothetical protein